jgi:sigma-B regulation protein RsbU (phosphoserine phosphatase)
MEKFKKFRRFIKLYTSGLNRREIEKLLQKDAVDAIYYLKVRQPPSVGEDDSAPLSDFRAALTAVKDIFLSFLLKLTPARRLCYGLAAALFLLGLIRADHMYLIVAFIGINFLLALELVDKLTTRDELEIAREIQLSLQPHGVPRVRPLSMAAHYQPARLVGGDFYDVARPSPTRMIGIIGDVSGKGVSAALYAAYAQSMFQTLAPDCASPAELFRKLNKLISQRLRDGDFITALAADFDLERGVATIARAGHNWPLLYQAENQTVTALRPRGLSIGLFTGPDFDDRLEEQTVPLAPGDCLVFYSDGVTEATNARKRMFDLSGLKRAVGECADQDSQSIVNGIKVRLRAFTESDELDDDATILAVKVDGKPSWRL